MGRDVSRGSRLRFAARRAAHHLFGVTSDDTALRRRIVRELKASGPGRRLPIDRVTDLDANTFFSRYYRTGTPVVLRGLAASWPAVVTWSPAFLKTRYGAQPLSVMDHDNTGGIFNVEELTIGDYMDAVEAGDTRKYLRFGNLLHRFPELAEDFDHAALARYMPRVRLGRNMGVFIGARGTRTRLHAAPPDNLFAQVYGTKRWLLFPSRFDPALRPVMARSTYYWSDFDPDAPDYDRFPEARWLDHYDVTLEPGDVLYNPASCWHQVTNLSPTIGVGFRWLSPMAARLNLSQLLLFFLATNPSLPFVIRNKRHYTRVLERAERKNRRYFSDSR